jgi:hypothetical protein
MAASGKWRSGGAAPRPLTQLRPDEIRPSTGRQTSRCVRTHQATTAPNPAGQSKAAVQPPLVRLPGYEKSGFLPFAISPRSSATSSHPIDSTTITTASTNHRRYLVAPLASSSWLGTPHRTIGAACRDGGGSAGSRHAAQVRHRPSGARQPARAGRTRTRPPCWANVKRRPS